MMGTRPWLRLTLPCTSQHTCTCFVACRAPSRPGVCCGRCCCPWCLSCAALQAFPSLLCRKAANRHNSAAPAGDCKLASAATQRGPWASGRAYGLPDEGRQLQLHGEGHHARVVHPGADRSARVAIILAVEVCYQ